jgi:3-deoxy-D-manno-octulosonic-acid transferase
MFLLYNLALWIALLVTAPWWIFKLLTSARHRAGLRERLGKIRRDLRRSEQDCIWIHAVSAGEVLAIAGLVKGLRREFSAARVVVSTTTATGQKLARERFGAENVIYFPLDFEFAIRPYLETLRPKLVVLAETEFWPNFLRMAKAQGAQIAVVNARISDRSLPGYRRWRRWMQRVLANVDLFLAQSEEDARRLVAIGAPEARVHVGGNLKFDFEPLKSVVLFNERELGKPVIVCGSTMAGEEAELLESFAALLPENPAALMILAPRHPERFEEVASLAERFAGERRLNFWRRSQLARSSHLRGGVLLLDTMGELASLYSLATIAFVGGSLVPRGGHNILEPAYFGVPIVVGPYTENFRDVIQIFQRANALRIVRDKEALAAAFRELLCDEKVRHQLGERAKALMREHAGATACTMKPLGQLMSPASQEVLAHAER